MYSVPQSDSRCVLIVDDNADNVWTLASLLRFEGYVVHTAPGGREAIELALRLRPAVILMDIGMPGIDGFEAARQIRMQPHGKEIFMCAISAFGLLETRPRAQKAGFDEYLQKPADLDDITSMLVNVFKMTDGPNPPKQGARKS